MHSLQRFREAVVSGGIEEAGYKQISDRVQDNNRRAVLIFSVIAVVAFLALLVTSFFVASLSDYSVVYAAGLAISAVVWSLAYFAGGRNQTVMLLDVYLFAALLLSVGILLGTVMSPGEIAATYIALMLALPQVFTDRPWRMALLIVLSVVVFIGMTLRFKDPATRSSDITNAVVFGCVSLVLCTVSMTNRIRRFYLEYQIRYLAENDQLTGLKNRYSYQMYLDSSAVLKSRSIYCIYVDVNGLHELNNTQGHEAGDKMLQYIASVMQHQFGKEGTYRIGGDEFVALGIDMSLEEIREKVSAMKQAVESAGYHIAAGVCLREKTGIEFDSIIKDAEKEMYSDKAEYYRQTGKDRRR